MCIVEEGERKGFSGGEGGEKSNVGECEGGK